MEQTQLPRLRMAARGFERVLLSVSLMITNHCPTGHSMTLSLSLIHRLDYCPGSDRGTVRTNYSLNKHNYFCSYPLGDDL